MTGADHVPVLCEEVIVALTIAPGERHVDGTFGAGGYTQAMLARGAEVCAFDRDPDAIAAAKPNHHLRLFEACFSDMESVLSAEQLVPVDGVALDIGVSSMQLDRAARGFSFQNEGPLDMRMAQSGESAADFLNSASEDQIADIIYRYGDEPKSRRIARAIVAARPLITTVQLASIVRRATGYKPYEKKDPATRTFQAIRIHINRELDELQDGLMAAERILRPGGRLAVVTFHSLEDRIVKQFLRLRSGGMPTGSRHAPLRPGNALTASFEHIAKPVRPADAEVARNPRARSATLRVARRTDAPAWPDFSGDAQ